MVVTKVAFTVAGPIWVTTHFFAWSGPKRSA